MKLQRDTNILTNLGYLSQLVDLFHWINILVAPTATSTSTGMPPVEHLAIEDHIEDMHNADMKSEFDSREPFTVRPPVSAVASATYVPFTITAIPGGPRDKFTVHYRAPRDL